jgi:hypothetical protein
MFTSSGLRLKVLVSKSYAYVPFIFLGLEYEGGYLCIPEENHLRCDPYCMFQCDKTELRKMKYEVVYFDTARTPNSRPLIDGLEYDISLEQIQVLCQQPHQHYKVSSVEVCMSSTQWDSWDTHLTNDSVYPGSKPVFGVIVLEVAPRSAGTSLEVGGIKIAIVVGEFDSPWCVIHQDFESMRSLQDIITSYRVDSVQKVEVDRDACYINGETIVSATFRRQFGEESDGLAVNYILSVVVHGADEFPVWVRVCLEDRPSHQLSDEKATQVR